MPSASWRLRGAGGIVLSGSEGLRPKEADCVRLSSLPTPENQELRCLKAGKDGDPRSRRKDSSFLHIFPLNSASTDETYLEKQSLNSCTRMSQGMDKLGAGILTTC